ncbi:ATP-dependent endonuclease [Streptomyces sp. NPDC056683]|uniref:ATP-dependent nuclease n=1 Tax=Streptomyces sp. NPDC056683 TaxID=3345910 RepID=UPI0036C2F0D7
MRRDYCCTLGEPVKIDSLFVRNFKGIHEFNIDSLSNTPLVVLAGKNGSGKSTLFLAISLAWTMPDRDTDYSSLVGPWDNSAEIRVTYTLTDIERQKVSAFQNEALREEYECPALVTMHLKFNRKNEREWPDETFWSDVLRNPSFQRENSFCSLDIIPAERSVSRDASVRVDPSLLGHEAIVRLRKEATTALTSEWSRFTLSDVPQYLTSLDYVDLVSQRNGQLSDENRLSDFEFIVENFHRATGKTIHRPALQKDGEVLLSIETPSGTRHNIGKLSSGELECLGLMYMARRIAAKGGVLLLDEPELHLHPALQTTITSVVQEGMQNAQMWLCTHSPSLINSAPLDALINVRPASADGANQAERVSEQALRLDLMTELGMHPNSVLQYDRVIVVEGETDRKYLQTLFPLETARSMVYVAGNKAAVLSMAKTLEKNEELFPWIAVCDRDLVDAFNGQGRLWVWGRRMIENCFLEGAVLSAAIGLVAPSVTPSEVEEKLAEIARSERGDVERLLVEDTVKERVRATLNYKIEKNDLASFFELERRRAEESSAILDAVSTEIKERLDSEWDSTWKALVNGKRVLADFLRFTPFRRPQNLMDAVCTAIVLRPEVEPKDITNFRASLIAAGF